MNYPNDELRAGLSPDDTVAAFVAACNRDRDRLFITESWFASFRARLLTALPATLSASLGSNIGIGLAECPVQGGTVGIIQPVARVK